MHFFEDINNLNDKNLLFEMKFTRRSFIKLTLATSTIALCGDFINPSEAKSNPAFFLIFLGSIAVSKLIYDYMKNQIIEDIKHDMITHEEDVERKKHANMIAATQLFKNDILLLPEYNNYKQTRLGKFPQGTLDLASKAEVNELGNMQLMPSNLKYAHNPSIKLANSTNQLSNKPLLNGILFSSLFSNEKEAQSGFGTATDAFHTNLLADASILKKGYQSIRHYAQPMEINGWNRAALALTNSNEVLGYGFRDA